MALPQFTNQVRIVFTADGDQKADVRKDKTGSGRQDWEGTIAPSTTNQLIARAFTMASMAELFIYASAALTIKTNSTSSPGQTITLGAGESLFWTGGGTAVNPITVDVTALYVTNASGSASADLQFYVLQT